MCGRDLEAHQRRISSFGWETIVIDDGHSFAEILQAYDRSMDVKDKPVMIIAGTIKGKGVSFMEDRNGWRGKAQGRSLKTYGHRLHPQYEGRHPRHL